MVFFVNYFQLSKLILFSVQDCIPHQSYGLIQKAENRRFTFLKSDSKINLEMLKIDKLAGLRKLVHSPFFFSRIF
jgi:hypothetical protein